MNLLSPLSQTPTPPQSRSRSTGAGSSMRIAAGFLGFRQHHHLAQFDLFSRARRRCHRELFLCGAGLMLIRRFTLGLALGWHGRGVRTDRAVARRCWYR